MDYANKAKVLEIRSTIARNLRSARLYAGKSQFDIGKFIGVSFQQIQKYEKGTNRIAAEDLYLLSGFLCTNINDFFNSENQEPEIVQNRDFLKIMKHLGRIKSASIRNKVISLAIALEKENEAGESDLLKEEVSN